MRREGKVAAVDMLPLPHELLGYGHSGANDDLVEGGDWHTSNIEDLLHHRAHVLLSAGEPVHPGMTCVVQQVAVMLVYEHPQEPRGLRIHQIALFTECLAEIM